MKRSIPIPGLQAAAAVALLALLLFASKAALADEPQGEERIGELERRLEELEQEREDRQAEPAPPTDSADWTRRVRLSGSANAGYFWGEHNSVFSDRSFKISDARFFIDADLGGPVRIGDVTIVRNTGFSFELDLVRLGNLKNKVGELYVDLQGIAESSWLNAQIGRFQIPVGEAYKRYSAGFWKKPFISNPVGAPWWWDEGVRFYGSSRGDRFGYVASISDGDTGFNDDSDPDKQYTVRLYVNPTEWLYLSASFLRGGRSGNSDDDASTALWLGESWGRAFGRNSSIDSYQNGVVIADGSEKIEDTIFAGVDAIVKLPRNARLWLAYGTLEIDSSGGTSYDRRLHYWIAELLLEGAGFSPLLADFYLGFRGSGLGTYDSGKGYLLDSRYKRTLGYNMKNIEAYSVVLGWHLSKYLTMRVEYTRQDIDLVDGVSSTIWENARKTDYFAIELGAHF